jgi:hypothetical protein
MRAAKILMYLLITVIVGGYSCRNINGGKSSVKIANTGTAEILFNEYEHDFGKIIEGEKVAFTFAFENKGKGPLIISSVNSSCGCTITKYETKPIPVGNTGNLEVVFDSSGKNGRQTKTITVNSNASKPTVLLRITGNVISSNNN